MKKGDVLIISLCVLLCALLFISSFTSKETLVATVYADGEAVKTVELSSVEKAYTFSVSGCEIKFEKDSVGFVSSSCKDKLCVKHGKLSKKNDTMACVPNKVVVAVKGTKNEKTDAVAY